MKRLVCCFDGTWNDDSRETALTNVVRLRRAILSRDAGGVPQMVRYVIGIGTGYQGNLGFLVGASGIEVGDRIKAGYRFLVDNWEPGDEIYLFGFSRGAFEARSLAGFIALIGMSVRCSTFSLDDAWRVYRNPTTTENQLLLAAMERVTTRPVPIKCVGVWDTVGNIGNPFDSDGFIGRYVSFHDTRLSSSVEVGLHALSIDELRGPFRPTFWTMSKGGAVPAGQTVEQVWFAGCHADVGGGYAETCLSDISLNWMAERVAALTGLGIDFEFLRSTTRPDPLGPQHSSTTSGIFKLSNTMPCIRLIRQNLGGVPALRRALVGSWRTSRTPRGEIPINETIHGSVVARFGREVVENAAGTKREFVYRPGNLAAVLKT